MSKNLHFTETGLDATEAYAVASRFAVTNAIADLVVDGFISEARGEDIMLQIKSQTAWAMAGEEVKIDSEGKYTFALNSENLIFQSVSNSLADDLDEIANQMEA